MFDKMKEIGRTLKGTVSGAYILATVKNKLNKNNINFRLIEHGRYNSIIVLNDDKKWT